MQIVFAVGVCCGFVDLAQFRGPHANRSISPSWLPKASNTALLEMWGSHWRRQRFFALILQQQHVSHEIVLHGHKLPKCFNVGFVLVFSICTNTVTKHLREGLHAVQHILALFSYLS